MGRRGRVGLREFTPGSPSFPGLKIETGGTQFVQGKQAGTVRREPFSMQSCPKESGLRALGLRGASVYA